MAAGAGMQVYIIEIGDAVRSQDARGSCPVPCNMAEKIVSCTESSQSGFSNDGSRRQHAKPTDPGREALMVICTGSRSHRRRHIACFLA